jgi:diaminohydroxyphosphoribosylaminopyrimidine deaminase/5-amino-6-(5-phosphoribosylamino)uracil reductase
MITVEPRDYTEIEERFARRAVELALKGVGYVSPSPLVGCVIVSSDGEVVGEGYYKYDQVQHAESIALEQAGRRASGGTAYVSLEPHAHFGRTPPCTEALIRAGINRVVAPIEDPNPKVAGKGFADLRSAGIEVVTGVLAEEAELANEQYILSIRKGRPFVHLKLACSLDGRIATRRGDSRWITGPEARARGHELRHGADAILVGAGTVREDDPLLTDRSNLGRRRPIVRVVLDGRLSIPTNSQLVRTARESPLVVFGDARENREAANMLRNLGVEVIDDELRSRDINLVLMKLKDLSIQSLLVEGGSSVATAFLEAGLVDKVTFFIAPIIIGGQDLPSAVGGSGAGKLSEALRLKRVTTQRLGSDIEITGYPEGL